MGEGLQTPNQRRLGMVARHLRLMASAAEGASEPRQFISIMQGLQECISLISLCMFNRQKKLIQAAAHDLDKNEIKGSI